MIQWLVENVKIKFVGDVMSISLMGDNPKEIVALVNSVTDAYLAETKSNEKGDRQRQYAELKRLFAAKQESLSAKRKEYENLAKPRDVRSANDLPEAPA